MKNKNSWRCEFEKLRDFTPLMAYDGIEPFDVWRARAKEKLTELLGLPLAECEEAFEIEYKRVHDGYIEYRFTVQTEPDYYVPCHLCIPHAVNRPVPLTLCLSGHGGGMHVALGVAKTAADEKALSEWPHRNMTHRALREGRAALVIGARSFGESSIEGYGTSCTEAAKIAIIMGRTLIGERVWDAMRILDVVSKHFPQVSLEGVMCTGNSGGGTATYYLACMDERITVAAPSCSVCTYEDSIAAMPHCLCNHIPSIRRYFEMGDLAALIAPRILIVAAGKEDGIFPIHGVNQCFERIKELYTYAGVPDRCALVIGEGAHLNYADLIWAKMYEMTGR